MLGWSGMDKRTLAHPVAHPVGALTPDMGSERTPRKGIYISPIYISRGCGLSPASKGPLVRFDGAPEIGQIVMLDEQAYELIDVADYVRADGVHSHLLTWETQCPSCGQSFRMKSGSSFHPNRRCKNCSRPGKPVKGKRGRRVSVALVDGGRHD